MDRRRFLRSGSLMMTGLCLPQALLAHVPANTAWSSISPSSDQQPLRRFAFGSCNQSKRDQSYWRQIQKQAPELWIWMGDIIYGDHLTMPERQLYYQDMKRNHFYSDFRSRTPIIGTWDDHDYASDNVDGSFIDKIESKSQILDFLDITTDPALQSRSGIYQSYTIGPVGQRTKIIMLDLRYNMDRQRQERLLLGDEQWLWLEEELRAPDYELLVIGSSLHVCSPYVGFGLEGWSGYGLERQRLYSLLAQVEAPTVILSGDRHQADISRFDPGHGRPVYEIMSSGLTHSLRLGPGNPYRLGRMFGSNNYGMIDIDWTTVGPRVNLQVLATADNSVYTSQWVDFTV